jgi:hypothetical protein
MLLPENTRIGATLNNPRTHMVSFLNNVSIPPPCVRIVVASIDQGLAGEPIQLIVGIAAHQG